MIFRFTITEEVEADTEEEAWDKIAELYDIIDSEAERRTNDNQSVWKW